MQMNDYIFNFFVLLAVCAVIYCLFSMVKRYVDLQRRINSSEESDYLNEEKDDYIKTTGHFTGNKRYFSIRTKTGYKNADYYEYEIKYYADDKEILGWHKFYPAPDPDDNYLAGKKVYLQYNPKYPHKYEILDYDLEEI